jgi:hypothetical protein
MDVEISEDILKQAGACKKDFSCLTGDREKFCEIEECLPDTIYFLKCLNEETCSYAIPYGSSYYCMCPVRRELYKRYGV